MSVGVVVLVIEDDCVVRELICRILKLADYEVDSVASSSAGYDRLCAGGIDVIVCDVMLPGELGPAMMARFNSEGHSVPVVYISGCKWMTLVKEKILPVGVPFLHKPFEIDKLLDWVKFLVSGDKED